MSTALYIYWRTEKNDLFFANKSDWTEKLPFSYINPDALDKWKRVVQQQQNDKNKLAGWVN